MKLPRLNHWRLLIAIALVLAAVISIACLECVEWLGAPSWSGHAPISFIACFLAVLALAIVVVIHQQHRESEASRAKLRGVLESALDGIAIVDRNGRIVLANSQVEQIFGYDWRELLGKPMDTLVTRRLRERLSDSSSDDPLEPMVSKLNLVGHRKDGSEFPVEISLCPQQTTDGLLVTSVIRDLSEQKRSAEILNLRERAMEAITEGLFILDANRPGLPIIYVNRAFECLTGYRRDEALACSWSFLLGPDGKPKVAEEIEAALAEARSYLVEFLVQRKDGSSFWSTLSFAPIRSPEGKVTHHVGVLADVSEHKRLESQLLKAQKMEAIGRLAGGVAHDFNNFLTVILGHGDLLRQMLPADHPGRGSVEEIAKIGERAAALTNQMLAFSRKQILAPLVVNLNGLINDIERMLGRLIRENIRMVHDLDPDLYPVKVDPGQIGQVLMNLVVNSRDAMPDGGQITIKTANAELSEAAARELPGIPAGKYAVLTVQDTGCGMDEAVRSRIFEPFFTTKEQGKGTGLGLATVYGIVKQSGGNIFVQSQAGQGAAFHIYLPRATEENSQMLKPTAQLDLAGKQATILLVEDEDAVRGMACKALEQAGFIVLQAANGVDALHLSELYEGTMDLLVTDVIMPQMSGGELAQRLLDDRPGIKILYISGYLDDVNVRSKIARSRAAFLAKPFTAQLLIHKVTETLQRRTRSRRREPGPMVSST